MAFPEPVPGLVIRYNYLWQAERERGKDEGAKDRPCAVVLVTKMSEGRKVVTVLPVTHSVPDDMRYAVEIPPATKRRLGLDESRSWVVLSEANRFGWPGPDLRPIALAQDASHVSYGLLPYRLMDEIRLKFIAALKERQGRVVPRTE